MNWFILAAGYIIIVAIFLGANSRAYKGEDDSTPWIGSMLLMLIFEFLWVIVWVNAFGV